MLVSDRDGWQDGEIFLLERVAAEITAPTTNEVRFLPLCGPLMFGQQPFPAIRAFGVRSPTHDELAGDVADKLVAQTIAALGQDSMPSDLWMPRDSEAWARVKPMIEAKCSWLGQRASAIAPPFVTRNRQIEALWLHPEDFDYTVGSIPFGEVEARETRWTVTRPPTPVVLALRDQTGELFRVDQAGSDTEAWAVFALSRALFELKGDLVDRIAERDFDVPPPSSYGQRQLYVIDEPERHLHPQAQREAAQFLADLARDGADVVIATHSPAFLHVPYSDAAYLRVSRDESGTTRATEITGDLLRHLERAVESLGLTRADLIQLTRAALIVEGEHDSWILRDLYGDRLSAAFIRILKLSGAHNTLALLDAELLRSLGLPTIVLLDDTHLDNIRQLADRKLPPGASPERSGRSRSLSCAGADSQDSSSSRSPTRTSSVPCPRMQCTGSSRASTAGSQSSMPIERTRRRTSKTSHWTTWAGGPPRNMVPAPPLRNSSERYSQRSQRKPIYHQRPSTASSTRSSPPSPPSTPPTTPVIVRFVSSSSVEIFLCDRSASGAFSVAGLVDGRAWQAASLIALANNIKKTLSC